MNEEMEPKNKMRRGKWDKFPLIAEARPRSLSPPASSAQFGCQSAPDVIVFLSFILVVVRIHHKALAQVALVPRELKS